MTKSKDSTKSNGTKSVSAKAAKKFKVLDLPKPVDEELDDGVVADEEDEVSDVDDQTEALLKGFESDGDEDEGTTKGHEEGQPIPKLPTTSTKALKKLKKSEESEASDKPGVVYVGRIPHGFYENEMREYFKQFGTILKLRMSRNPKTGASRHFAFIQFESAGVADIVARTMDNYLLFNHILKVKLVPDEQVHEELFKGANKRFKKIPWNKLKGRELTLGASEATWEKRIEKEEKRRQQTAEKAKELGYEFQSPKIKSAINVAKRPVEQITAVDGDDAGVKAIEGAPEPTKGKKKGKKANAGEAATEAVKETEATSVTAPVEASTKAKKEKKTKQVPEVEASVPDVTDKKLKKKKSTTSPVEDTGVDGIEGEQKKKAKKGKKA